MTSPWRVVDLLNFEGTVYAKRGSLRVDGNLIPLADLAVILTGVKTSLHSSVFDRAAEFDIALIHCDWRGVPRSTTFTWSKNSKVASRHLAQASLSLPMKKNIWMKIVKAKVLGQSFNINFDESSDKTLKEMAKKVRSGDPSNIEAQAAKYYWSKLFSEARFNRIPQTRSGINALLDYGYAVVRGVVLKALVAAGLWPTLGIWHKNRENSFCLVDDVMEPFRPCVDFQAKRLVEDLQFELNNENKRTLVQTLSKKLLYQGFTLDTVIEHFAQHLAMFIEGSTNNFKVPVFQGYASS
jgi:CRISPR-associated protein Cas1